jgi:phage gp16-like protein
MNALAAIKYPPNPKRNAMIGKIMVAKKQLRMVEDDYRQMLLDETTEISLTNCSEPQLAKMIAALKAKGFRPVSKRKQADHPMARKALAMWISLHHLNVVENPSDKALEAFAKRQLGVSKLQWADQSQGYKLIEALKDMAERNGWSHKDIARQQDRIKMLQRRLCDAILEKLVERKAAHIDWRLEDAAFKLLGIEWPAMPTIENYSTLAKGLGQKLRELLS